MRELVVDLGERSYSIFIGKGLLGDPRHLMPHIYGARVVVVTNTTVRALHYSALKRGLNAEGIDVVDVVLPDGEQYKNWEALSTIFDALIRERCERTTTLVALGGGVIGDMCGFAAACYQRGVPFVQLPTTLLSQVDSSVGGKTAINHPAGKNMIGAFYQPRLVLADTDTLDTLSDRQLSSGLAEVIKYGLIRDMPFLEWLEENIERLLVRDPEALAYAIHRSCTNKAEVVASDERETGERALLNLGHTFGHAIEVGMGYGYWLHGEAVAAGTMMAAELSASMGYLAAADVRRVEKILARAKLPTMGPALPNERYLELMRHDKKVEGGRLRLVLLERIGHAIVSGEASDEQIVDAVTARRSG